MNYSIPLKYFLAAIFSLGLILSPFAQRYNEVIADSEINKFMVDVLTSKEPYESAFNKKNKKIYYKPIHIRRADWDLLNNLNSKELDFENKFKKVIALPYLNKDDIDFIKRQFESIKDTTWGMSNRKIKFRKKYKINRFKYSIPLFNKEKNIAILWRYQYCGSLCAYSELHTYKLIGSKWILGDLIGGYIS